jgi:DNA-binding HxlR family transcriptional regulator
MDSFGDRWSLLVIRDMMLWGKRRYSEFLASGEGISTNILADRLKQMQRLGLVEKFRDPSNGKTSVYLLTDKGLSLFPVLLEVIRWGLQHDEHSMVPDPIAAALLDDSQALATEVAEQIKSERLALQQH